MVIQLQWFPIFKGLLFKIPNFACANVIELKSALYPGRWRLSKTRYWKRLHKTANRQHQKSCSSHIWQQRLKLSNKSEKTSWHIHSGTICQKFRVLFKTLFIRILNWSTKIIFWGNFRLPVVTVSMSADESSWHIICHIFHYCWLLPNRTFLDFSRTSPELTRTHLDSKTCETLVLIIFTFNPLTANLSIEIVPNYNLFPVNHRFSVHLSTLWVIKMSHVL